MASSIALITIPSPSCLSRTSLSHPCNSPHSRRSLCQFYISRQNRSAPSLRFNAGVEGRPFKEPFKMRSNVWWSQQSNLATKASSSESNSVAAKMTMSEVLSLWRGCQAVCFDVDSTVCTDEGIDQLAEYCGKGEEVKQWTTQAMSGNVRFQDALSARLQIMNPKRNKVEQFLAENPPSLTPGIDRLIALLHAKGKNVFLVSGGFRQMIYPVADLLSIPHSHVFANSLLFKGMEEWEGEGKGEGETGDFMGFDPSEPTSRTGGKAEAVRRIKQSFGIKLLTMVGDGVTDLEARLVPGAADLFIGFGGVQERKRVREEADWFVKDFEEMIIALKES